MNYIELRSLIRENSNLDFAAASNNLQRVLFDISRTDVLSLKILDMIHLKKNYIQKFRIFYLPKPLKK